MITLCRKDRRITITVNFLTIMLHLDVPTRHEVFACMIIRTYVARYVVELTLTWILQAVDAIIVKVCIKYT